MSWAAHNPEADEMGWEPPDPHDLADRMRQEMKDGDRCPECARPWPEDFDSHKIGCSLACLHEHWYRDEAEDGRRVHICEDCDRVTYVSEIGQEAP